MSLDDLREYKNADLFETLRLSDDDFKYNWLVPLGLLHGRMTCVCGNNMQEVTDSKAAPVYF